MVNPLTNLGVDSLPPLKLLNPDALEMLKQSLYKNVTKTGNNGSSKDITPKVEVYRKSLNKTIVKFEFTIKITNEGDIAGYAREKYFYSKDGELVIKIPEEE